MFKNVYLIIHYIQDNKYNMKTIYSLAKRHGVDAVIRADILKKFGVGPFISILQKTFKNNNDLEKLTTFELVLLGHSIEEMDTVRQLFLEKEKTMYTKYLTQHLTNGIVFTNLIDIYKIFTSCDMFFMFNIVTLIENIFKRMKLIINIKDDVFLKERDISNIYSIYTKVEKNDVKNISKIIASNNYDCLTNLFRDYMNTNGINPYSIPPHVSFMFSISKKLIDNNYWYTMIKNNIVHSIDNNIYITDETYIQDIVKDVCEPENFNTFIKDVFDTTNDLIINTTNISYKNELIVKDKNL